MPSSESVLDIEFLDHFDSFWVYAASRIAKYLPAILLATSYVNTKYI